MRSVLGIILGGGQGKRLYPLTKYRSKPAVPLGGKYRLIDIPISNLINSGVDRIFILTQFNSASLNRHVNLTYKFDFFRGGFVDILAAEQTVDNTDWFQGTADAVRKNMRHFPHFGMQDYLILAGDHIYRMDFRDMARFHREHQADVTVGVTPVPKANVSAFGILQVGKDSRIVEFFEKPKDEKLIESLKCPREVLKTCGLTNPDKLHLASMGIYMFKTDALESALCDMSLTDFGGDVIPKMIKTTRVFGYPFAGYWEDIGTIEAFYQANLNMTSPHPPFDFASLEHPIYTNPRFLPGTKIHGATLKDCIIADGSLIKEATINHSIVGLRSIIEKGAIIEHTYLMGADYIQNPEELSADANSHRPHIGIGQDSIIRKAIIDKNARIGKNVIIGPHAPGDDLVGSGYVVKNGITVVEKDAVIPEGSVI
jgi:glucose-1-phosphate adenylyltransferase